MQEVYQCTVTPPSCHNTAHCTPVITVCTWMMTSTFSPLLLYADACIITQMMYSATIPAFPCRCCTLLQCSLLLRADACFTRLQVLYSATIPASPACRCYNPCITCRYCTLLQCLLLPLADAHFSRMRMPANLTSIFMLTPLSSQLLLGDAGPVRWMQDAAVTVHEMLLTKHSTRRKNFGGDPWFAHLNASPSSS